MSTSGASHFPVYLGVVDAPMSAGEDSSCGWWTNKIGGHPNWLDGKLPSTDLTCRSCGKPLSHMAQIYAPLETAQTKERVLHAFACLNSVECTMSRDGWRVLRASRGSESSMQSAHDDDAAHAPAADSHSGVAAPSSADWFVHDFASPSPPVAEAKPDDAADDDDMGDIEKLLAQRDAAGRAKKQAQSAGQPSGTKKTPPASSSVPKTATAKTSSGPATAPVSSGPEGGSVSALPKTAPLLKPFYMNVDEEPREKPTLQPTAHELELIHEYERNQQTGSSLLDSDGEGSSAPAGPADIEGYETTAANIRHGDVTFAKFLKRLQRSPDQVVRYAFDSEPLLVTNIPQHLPPRISPPCPSCKGKRVFEMQLLSTLISQLKPDDGTRGSTGGKGDDFLASYMEWGTILVYSCEQSCSAPALGASAYTEEFVFVQPDPDILQLAEVQTRVRGDVSQQ